MREGLLKENARKLSLHQQIIHDVYMGTQQLHYCSSVTNILKGTANGTYHSTVLTKIITRMGNGTNVTHSGDSPRAVISFVLQRELYSSAEDENVIFHRVVYFNRFSLVLNK